MGARNNGVKRIYYQTFSYRVVIEDADERRDDARSDVMRREDEEDDDDVEDAEEFVVGAVVVVIGRGAELGRTFGPAFF